MAMQRWIDRKATVCDGKSAERRISAGAARRETEASFTKNGVTVQPGSGAGVWIASQLSAALKAVKDLLFQAFERIANAQSRTGRHKQMRLIESLPLGNRRQLLLIDCGNQRYLVGAGADSVGSILAMERSSATGSLAAKGPELVRGKGRETAPEVRRGHAISDAGLNPWR